MPNIVLEEPTNAEDINRTDTIETLEDDAILQAGKSTQLAAKKISKKYKRMREANRRKNTFRLPGEIVKIETVETPQGNVKVPVSIPKTSKIKTAQKIRKKYDKIRQDKTKKLACLKGKEIVEKPKVFTKSAGIAAKKNK